MFKYTYRAQNMKRGTCGDSKGEKNYQIPTKTNKRKVTYGEPLGKDFLSLNE